MKLLSNQADHFLCYYTLMLDSYSKFCDIGCIYCYASSFQEEQRNAIDIDDIEQSFQQHFRDGVETYWSPLFSKRIPIRLGYETDPFQVLEKKFKITKRLLTLFKEYDYPHIIFTKSELILEQEYLDLLSPKLTFVQVSISSYDQSISKLIEPRAPFPEDRVKIINTLSERGIPTALRVNLLPPSLRKNHPLESFDKYKENIELLITKSKTKKIILNEIIDRTTDLDNTFNLENNLWSEWKDKFLPEDKILTYCYLGSSSSRFFMYENKSCVNCCQCDLSSQTTRKDISIRDHFKLNAFPQSLLSFLNNTLLKFMMIILKKALK